jgi:hypothetical protein
MNQEILNRYPAEKPIDPHELVFWYLDSINLHRRRYWRPEMLEPNVRELGDHLEDLYTDWLRAEGIKATGDDLIPYLYLVLPYISFRLLNSKPSIEVSIFDVSSAQKTRFIDYMITQHEEFADNTFLRKMLEESLKKFLTFLKAIRRRREQ